MDHGLGGSGIAREGEQLAFTRPRFQEVRDLPMAVGQYDVGDRMKEAKEVSVEAVRHDHLALQEDPDAPLQALARGGVPGAL